jgi:molybdate transport system substrate-binding protein
MKAMVRSLAVLLAIFGAGLSARAAEPVTVLAAASLTDVLQDAGNAYESQGGGHVVFSFAASSALARQIEASGGADIFVSADED